MNCHSMSEPKKSRSLYLNYDLVFEKPKSVLKIKEVVGLGAQSGDNALAISIFHKKGNNIFPLV
jgi:hypothetical protein